MKKEYFINFIEEFWMPGTDIAGAKVRDDIGDFHTGRIEVYVEDEQYDIDEIRFFTKDPDFYKFRNKWDFKDINAKQLEEIRKIVKEKYQERGS